MRLLFFALLALIALAVVAAVPVSAMVFLMSPSTCVDRPVEVSQAASNQVDELLAEVRAGYVPEDLQVTLNESEVSSRLATLLREEGAPVDDVKVYLCPGGYAEVTGKLTDYGGGIDFLVRGDIEARGDSLVVTVQDTEVGGLPGGLAGPIADGIVEDVMREHGLYDLEVGALLESVEIGDGYVTVAGSSILADLD